jgi:hypothetical protein
MTTQDSSRPGESVQKHTDRRLIELLTELGIALPGAQILLGFLLTVPFAAAGFELR